MDLTKKRYNISYDTDETVTTEDTGCYTGAISGGTLHPGYGAVPPGSGTVIISSPDAIATYTPTSLTVKPNYANTTISSNGISNGGYTYTMGTGGGSPWATNTNTTLTGGKLHLEGKDADVIIDGKSLLKTLKALEERLNILVPNSELEAEWAELKQLGDQYRELEAKLTEQVEVWRRLKAT
jgi:hypothetical protein